MKICIIHYSYPPVIGGVETIVYSHAHLFQKHGFQTKVLCGTGKAGNEGLEVKLFPEFNSLGLTNPALREKINSESFFDKDFHDLSARILSILEKECQDFDIIIAHNILSLTLNPALGYALKHYAESRREKRFISWTHDVLFDVTESGMSTLSLSNPELKALMYTPLKNVSYVAISQHLKNTMSKLMNLPDDKIKVISNGVNIPSFLNFNPLTVKIIDKYDLLNKSPLLFLPSKIMPHKQIEITIKLLAELKNLYKNPFLVISAKRFPHSNLDDEYVNSITSMIQTLGLKKDVCILTDELGKDNLQDYEVVKDIYLLSDLIVNLSRHENFGLPILEGGLSKTPMLCSKLPAFEEIEPVNLNYIDTDIETPKDIANKTKNILSQSKEISLLSSIKKTYNLESIFKRDIEPFLNQLHSDS